MQGLSRSLLRLEKGLAGLLTFAILVLVGFGSVARGLGYPQVWTDELAVHLMVMLAFIAASMGVALQNHMAMGLMPESLGPRGRRVLARVNQGLILAFMALMAVLVWIWLDLPGLIAAGSGEALAEASFNFAWTDPTLTLGMRKIWFWLVVPASVLAGSLHVLAQIVTPLPEAEA
ncbi:TRAP transporter small permease [Falsigemmobacter faecalis]|uniref:TRAP transporter small permease protein n=1 Tax=Falsigemmobacter faecalis TaxID=2488730 RepID=A0A3P3DXB8_9RHOB|nr:TRAP transporter small permease subunit [Falsigemmobacter faecalis]RRH78132.1 TRAP transporter small permease subunit [Falsigemmobacter faecalis]